MTQVPESYEIDAVQATLEHTMDVSDLERAFADGRLDPDEVIAVTGKTEGCAQPDTSRVDADRAIRRFLSERGTRDEAELASIPMVFTAGGVGILSPQVVVYTRRASESAVDGAPRLAIGTARSSVTRPEWSGTTRVIEENVAAIRAAADDGRLDLDEVEYLIGKAYSVPLEEIDAARAAGAAIPPLDYQTLFRKTSGSGGLAAAVALDGLPMPSEDEIATRLDLFSAKASFSSNPWEAVGGDGPHTQVIAMGNHAGAGGRLRVGHAAVADLLDVGALPRALRRAGLEVGPGPLTPEQRARVVALYVKIGPSPDGRLRGRRQVLDNPNYGGELKAAVAGAFAAQLQDNLIYISGSATHQGPAGGGTLAAVVDVS